MNEELFLLMVNELLAQGDAHPFTEIEDGETEQIKEQA